MAEKRSEVKCCWWKECVIALQTEGYGQKQNNNHRNMHKLWLDLNNVFHLDFIV